LFGGVEKHRFGRGCLRADCLVAQTAAAQQTGKMQTSSCCCVSTQLAYAAAPAQLRKHEQRAAAARPNWRMQQHQHSWASMNKQLLLLLRPNWLMQQHQHSWANMNKSCCC
jgi:hypothetical protein